MLIPIDMECTKHKPHISVSISLNLAVGPTETPAKTLNTPCTPIRSEYTGCNDTDILYLIAPPVWDEPWLRPVPMFFGGLAAEAAAGPMDRMNGAMAMAAPKSTSLGSAPVLDLPTITPKESLAPVTRTRKLFPETWLWASTAVELVHRPYQYILGK